MAMANDRVHPRKRKKVCSFCVDKVAHIDFKDTAKLRRYPVSYTHLEMPLRQRVELIAKEVYGADGVDWAPLAVQKAERFESDPKYADYCTMMVKTHLSLSDDPTKKGEPKGWRLAIRDILEYGGAKFLCPIDVYKRQAPATARAENAA